MRQSHLHLITCKLMMRVPIRDKRPHREGLSSPGWDGRTTTNWRGQTDDNLPWLRNQKWHRGRVRCLQAKRSLTLEQYSGADCPNQGVELSILPNDVSRLLRVEPLQQLKFVSPDTSISRSANCIYTVSNSRKARNNFPQHFSASRQKAKIRGRVEDRVWWKWVFVLRRFTGVVVPSG